MVENLEQEVCVICGEDLDGVHETACQMCGGKFHQPWRQDGQVPQCGHIGSHDEALALVYLCNDCYSGERL